MSPRLQSDSLGAGKLGADGLGSRNHVLEGWLYLSVLASLETTIWVDPQDVGVKNSKHLVNSVSNLLRCWYRLL